MVGGVTLSLPRLPWCPARHGAARGGAAPRRPGPLRLRGARLQGTDVTGGRHDVTSRDVDRGGVLIAGVGGEGSFGGQFVCPGSAVTAEAGGGDARPFGSPPSLPLEALEKHCTAVGGSGGRLSSGGRDWQCLPAGPPSPPSSRVQAGQATHPRANGDGACLLLAQPTAGGTASPGLSHSPLLLGWKPWPDHPATASHSPPQAWGGEGEGFRAPL